MLTDAIVKRIPDYENVKDERVRGAYGMTASIVGISCQCAFVCGKAAGRTAQRFGRDYGGCGQ